MSILYLPTLHHSHRSAECERWRHQPVEHIIKAEFDAIYNGSPHLFLEVKSEDGSLVREQSAHKETGEPSLVIRKREVK